MGKISRGPLTLSTNIIMTASLVTRTLTFGYVMLSIYIKVGDDILDKNVMKMVNIERVFGVPLGSTVQSIVFSLIAVFVLEFMTGILGLLGAVKKRKYFLVIAVLMSVLMICVYIVYIVLLALIYHETDKLYYTLLPYAKAYGDGNSNEMNSNYYHYVFPNFLSELGCGFSTSEYQYCYGVYKQQVRTYLQTYFGIIITCLLCHVVSIIAVEYTYRKLEYKETRSKLSTNEYYLLLTIRHGIGRNFACFIRENWRKSKIIVFSVIIRIISLVVSLGLLGLGLTLCGDVFIIDGSLRHLFYQLKFYQYTFYDILIGLAASAIVIGVLGAAVTIVSLLGTWRKSKRFTIVTCISSTMMLIPMVIVVVLWAVFIDEINGEMRPQMRIQQNGYYINGMTTRITGTWNYMVMTLDCCGVDYSSDTINTGSYGKWFCCKNAHESRMEPFGRYNNMNAYLSYFGSCGGYKSDTCSEKILFKSRMYIGWFLAIVLFKIVLEVIGISLLNKEYFISFYQTDDIEESSKCGSKCFPFFVIFKVTASGIKSFFVRHCKRSKPNVVYLLTLGLIMVFSICLLSLAINIRYDTVFGNGHIEELLRRINITDTNLNKSIENFSTVVSTFSVAAICTVIYSVSILVPDRCKLVFVIVGLGLWVVMALSHIIEIGLWAKFLTEVNSSVTYQLALDIYSYSYSDHSEYQHSLSFYWNTLFVKAKCCGVSSTYPSFVGTSWYLNRRGSRKIPVQCCTSQTEIYPYGSPSDSTCTDVPQSYHGESCDTAIEDRLKKNYSTPFFVFTSLIVIAEILCIITIVISLIKKTDQDENIHLIHVQKGAQMPERKFQESEKHEVKTNLQSGDKISKIIKNKKTKSQPTKNDLSILKKENTTMETDVKAKDAEKLARRNSVKSKSDSQKTKDKKESETKTASSEMDNTDLDDDVDKMSVVQTDTTNRQSVDFDRQTTSSSLSKRQSEVIRKQSVHRNLSNRQSDIEMPTSTSNAQTDDTQTNAFDKTVTNNSEDSTNIKDKTIVSDLDVEEIEDL